MKLTAEVNLNAEQHVNIAAMFRSGGLRVGGQRPWTVAAVLCALILSAAPAHAVAGEQTDPGSIETFTYGEGDQQYKYIVYTPTSYDPGHAAPLLVMAHGCQTTADEQMRASLFNPIAEREGFIVMYPDVTPFHEQQPGPLRNCWQFPLPTSWHRDSGDAGAIAGMTTTVMEGWNIDTERVYMVGISAGGFMTSIMAAAYPDLYAAVGVIAAGAYADGTCLVGRPWHPGRCERRARLPRDGRARARHSAPRDGRRCRPGDRPGLRRQGARAGTAHEQPRPRRLAGVADLAGAGVHA